MVEFCVKCDYINEDVYPLSDHAIICNRCRSKIKEANKKKEFEMKSCREIDVITEDKIRKIVSEEIYIAIQKFMDKEIKQTPKQDKKYCPDFVLGDNNNCVHHCGEYNEYARYVTFCCVNGKRKACVDLHKYNQNVRDW